VHIILQSLHAEGRLSRKSISDIEAVANKNFYKTWRGVASEPHVLEGHREEVFVPRQ